MKNLPRVYIHLRPRAQQASRVISQLEDLMALHPHAGVKIVGLGADDTHATISVEIELPKNNSHQNYNALGGLYFAQDIFTSLFDYSPCYSAPPTDTEVQAIRNFFNKREAVKNEQHENYQHSERGLLAIS